MIEEKEHVQSGYSARIRHQLESELIGPGLDPPRVIFHYTTAEGIKGIIETDSIWATNYRYVNDLAEFTYANSLLRDELSARLQSESPLLRAVFEQMLADPDTLLGPVDMFLACFCDQGDLLSQWRAYGSRGGGYALGLSATQEDLVRLGPNRRLFKVSYNKEQQLRLIRFLLDAYVRDVTDVAGATNPADIRSPALTTEIVEGRVRMSSSWPIAIARLTVELANAFIELACCFKNPCFAEEREWRLVLTRFDSDEIVPYDISLRTVGATLVPYATIPLNIRRHRIPSPRRSWTFQLDRIIYGPGLNTSTTVRSLKYLVVGRH